MNIVTVKIEIKKGYLYQFYEGYEEAPWMRSIHNKTFKQYSCNLFPDNFLHKPPKINNVNYTDRLNCCY